ncbi:MAG: hypothetical protein M1820_005965 [Bogoriella megaspora]|nr:MAG: hypothetical protein M1820_005965 [Bogoriella megaspora]
MLKDRKGERARGTCHWITQHAKYVQWANSEPTLLWISGGPGKGKTFIALYITEVIARREKQQGQLLYFFYRDSSQITTGNVVLMSLIYQLLEHFPILFPYILQDFRLYGDRLFDPARAESLHPLWQIFSKMARSQSIPKINCVLDGLDECDPVSLKPFLAKLETLFRPAEDSDSGSVSSSEGKQVPDQVDNRIRFLITSRENCAIDLRPYFADFSSIRLDTDCQQEIQEDLVRFISQGIEKTARVQGWPKSEAFHNEIVAKLVQRAEGVYLWVALVMKELRSKFTVEVFDTINGFPRELEDVYDRLLSRILPSRIEMASRILLWVLGACRVLSLEELATAVNVNPATGQTCQEAATEVARFCGNIIEVHGSGVQLCHATARDYLLDLRPPHATERLFNFSREYVHHTMSQACLAHIEMVLADEERALEIVAALREMAKKAVFYDDEGIPLTGRHIAHFDMQRPPGDFGVIPKAWLKAICPGEAPLFLYAAHWWPTHARVLSPGDVDKYELGRKFFTDASLRESWHRIHLFLVDPRAAKHQSEVRDVVKSLLHLASYYGLIELLRKVLNVHYRPQNTAAVVSQMRTEPEDEILDLVNIANEDNGYTSLMYAAEHGFVEAIGLLLEYGASIDPADRTGRASLHLACQNGHIEAAKLLLERGASTSGLANNLNVMQLAILSGNVELVEVLRQLPQGRELISYNGLVGSSLHSAASVGEERMLKYLLDERPDLEARDHEGRTPLHYAVLRISETAFGTSTIGCVKLLLEKGSDVSAKDTYGNTPLYDAAGHNFEAAIRLLVKHRADIHALNYFGETPIYNTVRGLFRGVFRETRKEVTEVLLELGADVDHYSTVKKQSLLHFAIETEREDGKRFNDSGEVIDVLLEHGADTSSRDYYGRSPLVFAAQLGSSKTVEKLLRHNADINAQDDYGNTALWSAVTAGSHSLMRILLLNKADPNIVGREGLAALNVAVMDGDIGIVQLLVASGAKADHKMLNHAAKHNGCRIILEELLKGGADLNGCSQAGLTSLKLAACNGKTATAAFLAKKHVELVSSQSMTRSESTPSQFDVWVWFARLRSSVLQEKRLGSDLSMLHTFFDALDECAKLQEKIPRDLSRAARAGKMHELFSQRGLGDEWRDFTKWFKDGKPLRVGFEEDFERTE